MVRLLIKIVFLALFVVSASHAREYGRYDKSKIVFKDDNGVPKIRMQIIDAMIDDLKFHAEKYPVQFDSAQDRDRAKQDMVYLVKAMDVLATEKSAVMMWTRASMVNSLAYNFNIEGSLQKAVMYFERILAKDPNEVYANYYYGVFLAGIPGKQKEAIGYLEKAVKLGVTKAYWGLSLSYLSLNDKKKAIEYMQEYKHNFPNDKNADIFLDAISNIKGNVEIKQTKIKN